MASQRRKDRKRKIFGDPPAKQPRAKRFRVPPGIVQVSDKAKFLKEVKIHA